MSDDVLSRAEALLDLGAKAVNAYQRHDLLAPLDAVRSRLRSQDAVVLVAGEFKKGKSSLVNALLGVTLCPVDDDISTTTPTLLRYGPALEATAVFEVCGEDSSEERESVTIEVARQLATQTTQRAPSGAPPERWLRRLEIAVPNELLQRGLTVVDTPGAGGLGGAHGAITMATVPLADAVLFVSDASSELTAAELSFLRNVVRLAPTALFVESKIDLYPRWREMVELDRGHLSGAGIEVPVLGASAVLRSRATSTADRALNEESGAPAVLRWLVQQVLGQRDRTAVRNASAAVRMVAEALCAQFEAERAALAAADDPDARAAQRLQVQAQLDAARIAASQWGQAFNDAFADFSNAIDNDLRDRLRKLTLDTEDLIDRVDPARSWDEIERRLPSEAASAVAEHCAFRQAQLELCIAAMQRILDGVVGSRVSGAVADVGGPSLTGSLVRPQAMKAQSLGDQILNVLRTTQTSAAMFGFFGGLTGLVLAAPAMAGLGLLLGGRGLRDERARQLAQRQSQAKAAIRRYLDDLTIILQRDSRDTLRLYQRSLRDHCAEVATATVQQMSEVVAATSRALDAPTAGRSVSDIDAELGRIRKLEQQAIELAGAL